MLFGQRARAARAGFVLDEENAADVAAICARLDGLPLAIELAAARVSHLAPAAILERIDRRGRSRLPLLTGGSRDLPIRLQTMRNAIAWSHDLLDDAERALFRRLAAFSGGFSIEAAAAVGESDEWSALDGIRSLLGKSLLRDEGARAGEPRFGMLETIREFGRERLALSGEADQVRQRHAAWCLDIALRAGATFSGADDLIWRERLEREHANLRSALGWLLERGDTTGLMRLAGALRPFWEEHAHYSEGRRWLEVALAQAGESAAADRLAVLSGAGTMAWYEGDFARATACHEQALILARAIGDRPAEAAALNDLGVQALELGDHERAAACYEASLRVARAVGDQRLTLRAQHNLAQIGRLRGDGAAAAPRIEEALTLARQLGEPSVIAACLNGLGHTMLDGGDHRRAGALFRESLELGQQRGNMGTAIDALEGLARLGATTGHEERAARLFGATAALRDCLGVPYSPSEIAYFAPAMQAPRDALGAAGFAAATAAGRSLSAHAAMTEAGALTTGPAVSLPPNVRSLFAASGEESQESVAAQSGITRREREVLRLLADGLSDKEIGAMLTISAETVTKHVGNLLRKLAVPSRTAAATLAVRGGFI